MTPENTKRANQSKRRRLLWSSITAMVVLAAVATGYALAILNREPEPRVWFYDVATKEYFADNATKIAPIVSPKGNEAVRANFFSCGDCTDEQRFVAYYEKYSQKTKDFLGTATFKIINWDRSKGMKGRYFSRDGVIWLEDGTEEALQIRTSVRDQCPEGKLRYCPP